MTQESMFSQQTVYPLMVVAKSSAWVVERYADMLERLNEEGFVVHVLASDDGGFEELAQRGIVCKPLPVGWSLNMVGLFAGYVIMQAYFLEERPLLVHAFDQPLAWVTAFAARRAHAAVVVATVDRHRLLAWNRLPKLEKAFARVYGLLNRKVDAYVVGTEEERMLAEQLGIDEVRQAEVVGGPDEAEQMMHLYDRLLSKVVS